MRCGVGELAGKEPAAPPRPALAWLRESMSRGNLLVDADAGDVVALGAGEVQLLIERGQRGLPSSYRSSPSSGIGSHGAA